jgi:predicted transcriptional regulator
MGESRTMSEKEIAIELIRGLPEDANLEEIAEEVRVLALVRRGEQDADAGRAGPHAYVKKKLREWIGR